MRSLTLGEVRCFMEAGGVAHLGNRCDRVPEARRIVGGANSTEPFLSNMIRALSLLTWRNTAEDWQRLEAALIVRAAKRTAARRQARARVVPLERNPFYDNVQWRRRT